MKEHSICIFGDSITWGAWDEEFGGWSNRLNIYFNTLPNGYLELYNLGMSGEDTRKMLPRVENECKFRNPDIIIFAIGINDSISFVNKPNVPINEFKNNIEKLIEIAKKFTNEIIFIGITNVDESKTTPTIWKEDIFFRNEEIKKYDKIIEEASKSNNLKYIKLFNLLKNEDLEDGIHPNANGHKKIFKEIKGYIENIINN